MAILSMNNMVKVTIDMSPSATVREGYNSGLILGRSARLNTITRIKEYTDLVSMAEDGFLISDPEYQAAQLYFSATKRAEKVFIGVCGADETYAEAAVACRSENYEWYGFTACDATAEEIKALAAFAESASPYSVYFYTTPYQTPTFDISYTGDAGEFTETISNGEITILFDSLPTEDPVASEFVVSNEGSIVPTNFEYDAVLGQVTLTFTPLEEDIDIDIFDEMKGLGYLRVHGMYSGQSNAVAAVMGYAMGANNQTNNSAYTLAYKSLPGVTPSEITEATITNIKRANGNVYVQRGGKYNVYEQGTQASGIYFDDIIGVDTLVGNVQASCMNLFVNSSKISYTDVGITRIINAITPDFEQARNVGFIAPGLWTYGDITVGDEVLLTDNTMLPTGYALLAPKVSSVSQVVRESRTAPEIICPVKLSGAIEHINITIPVNK